MKLWQAGFILSGKTAYAKCFLLKLVMLYSLLDFTKNVPLIIQASKGGTR